MLNKKDLDKYTAEDLLDFLRNEIASDYITEAIHDDFGDTVAITIFDTEKIGEDFLRSIHRYSVVRRGQKVYIHDDRECLDIMVIKVQNYDDEEAMQRAYDICERLNENDMYFIGKRHCD